MFKNTKAFSGYSVDDIDAATRFYGETLGVKVNELDPENGLLELEFPGDRNVLVYKGEPNMRSWDPAARSGPRSRVT